MSNSAPEAPDYAKANREGIYADIETLPIRRQIEQAAALGKGYMAGGKYYETKDDLIAAGVDPASAQSFEGLGNDVLNKQYVDLLLYGNDESARRQLALRQELGVANVEQSLKELEASDPEGYAARKAAQAKISDALGKEATVAPELEYALGDVFSKYKTGAVIPKELQDALAKSYSDFQLGGKLSDSVRSEVEQNVRGGQAARGNILGNASAFAEAQEIGTAGESRERQRLGDLVSIAGQIEGLKDQKEQTLFGNLTGLAGSVDTTKYGREQQKLADLSNFTLGNPIVNQFGALGGAQNGAVAYNPITPQSGTSINANAGQAGTSFALGNYSNQYQAAQNPWMNMGMGVAGNFLGGAAGAAGSTFGMGLF